MNNKQLTIITFVLTLGLFFLSGCNAFEETDFYVAPTTSTSSTTTTSTTITPTTSTTTTTGPTLYDINFNEAGTRGLACGTDGTVLLTTDSGATWSLLDMPSSAAGETFYKCYYNNDDGASVMGTNGLTLGVGPAGDVTNVDAWTTTKVFPEGTDATLYYADSVGTSDLIVGSGGTILYSGDYVTYAAVTIETSVDLYNFSVEEDEVLVVGQGGTILYSAANPGQAESWITTIESGTTADLYKVEISEDEDEPSLVFGANGTYLLAYGAPFNWAPAAVVGIPNDMTIYGSGGSDNIDFFAGSGGTLFYTTDNINYSSAESRTTEDLRGATDIEDDETEEVTATFIVGGNMTMLHATFEGTTVHWQKSTNGGQTWTDSWVLTAD
ncbi:hypothetical protein ACFL5U_01630 [Candidatus Margulisiibacteriota bacterium]